MSHIFDNFFAKRLQEKNTNVPKVLAQKIFMCDRSKIFPVRNAPCQQRNAAVNFCCYIRIRSFRKLFLSFFGIDTFFGATQQIFAIKELEMSRHELWNTIDAKFELIGWLFRAHTLCRKLAKKLDGINGQDILLALNSSQKKAAGFCCVKNKQEILKVIYGGAEC